MLLGATWGEFVEPDRSSSCSFRFALLGLGQATGTAMNNSALEFLANCFLTYIFFVFGAWPSSWQVNYICCYVLLAMIAFPSSCILFVASDSNVVAGGAFNSIPMNIYFDCHVYIACGKVKRSLHGVAVS